MGRLTIPYRIKITETYYKIGDSVTAMYLALRGDYVLHDRPTKRAIGKIVKKLEETGVVTNIQRFVYHRFVSSAENIAIASESVTEDPNLSISRRLQE